MSGFYRMGDPGQDQVVHLNTGRRASGAPCACPRFDSDSPNHRYCMRPSVALCDAPGCDKPVCHLHRIRDSAKANTNYCPQHKDLVQQKGLFE